MMNKTVAIALILVLVAGAGCNRSDPSGGAQKRSSSADETGGGGSDTPGKNGDGRSKQSEAVPVETALTHIGDISSYLVFNSTLETEGAVEIYPEIAGLVRKLLVEEGDRVHQGDILLQLNDEELNVESREAQVNLDNLESTFKRTEDLAKRGMINDQDFDHSRFELAQARLRLERAQLRLNQTLVRAPVTGVITERTVQIGARVGPTTKLFGMMRLDDMIARVFVPGRYLPIVHLDQVATLTSDFIPDVTFEGWIKRISPVIDPGSGTFKVTIGVTAPADQAPPGLFVTVRIITDTRRDAVLLPKEAIVYEGGERYVFLVEEGAAIKKPLHAGYENSRLVEALAGIAPGASIIVLGQNGLKTGTAVRIVKESAPTVTEVEPTESPESRKL